MTSDDKVIHFPTQCALLPKDRAFFFLPFCTLFST